VEGEDGVLINIGTVQSLPWREEYDKSQSGLSVYKPGTAEHKSEIMPLGHAQ
jgi:hypothetical protein